MRFPLDANTKPNEAELAVTQEATGEVPALVAASPLWCISLGDWLSTAKRVTQARKGPGPL